MMPANDYKLLYESTLAAKQELEAQHKLLGDEVKRLKAERQAMAPLLVLLKKFDSIMEGCGNWPDTSTSQVNLGDLAAEVREAIRKHEQKGGAA